MKTATIRNAALSALVSSSAVFAHSGSGRDHHEISSSLQKRDFSGQATYYYVGLGACGQNNVASDKIVALNTAQYIGGSPGPECFKYITITDGSGKSAVAQIMDECPSCAYGSLDMSESLFEEFNPLSVGEFSITWHYNDGSGSPPPQPKPKPKPKPTPPPPPPPPPKPTTHTTHTTHSTTKHTTTTQPRSTTHSKPSTTTTPTGTSSSPSASPSVPVDTGNILNVAEVVFNLANLLTSATNGAPASSGQNKTSTS